MNSRAPGGSALRRRRIDSVDRILSAVPVSPMIALSVRIHGRTQHLLVKDESRGGTGSVKDRTAIGLLRDLHWSRPIAAGTTIIESTSGNLGVALARLAARLECRLVAVVDPTLPGGLRQRLTAMGVELVWAAGRDASSYLLDRIAIVQRLSRENPHYRWPDQYSNAANWGIHRDTTGPELVAQAGSALDAIYVAVSTGGTLAGISAHVRTLARPIRLVAVDAWGSLVTGERCAPRLISGIGASRRSSFLSAQSYDYALAVGDAEAIATCRVLYEDVGLAVGGSSGSVLHGYLRDSWSRPRAGPTLAVCVCADSGAAYLNSYYHDDWLAEHGLLDEVRGEIRRLRRARVAFSRD